MLVIGDDLLERILQTLRSYGSDEERAWCRKVVQGMAMTGPNQLEWAARLQTEQGMDMVATGRVICLGEGVGETVGEAVGVTIEWATTGV